MCGIAGLLFAPGGDERDIRGQALRMTTTLAHRGPDGDGIWVEDGGVAALGHRRLAIIDVSPTGAQPMASADGRFVITYNGEVYNYRALKLELEALGVRFRGTSDTEAIVEGCAHWGVEATAKKLNGIFAIAIWDRRERVLWLVRDHLGIKPLYWAQFGDTFLFGSELKALRAHPALKPELDRGALGAFFQFNYIPAPNTIYRGVHKLMPGALLRVPLGGQPKESRYWDVYDVAAKGIASRGRPMGDEETVDALEALLKDSISGQMISDVPLGALLSGGIDSSTVVALMQAQSSRPIKTFSIGFDVDHMNEAPYAAAVAKHLGTDHTELYVQPDDALNVIPQLSQWYDEPFADSSQIPTHLVSKLARQNVTVALSGDGGDELFAGYTRYARQTGARQTMESIPAFMRGPMSKAMVAAGEPFWNKVAQLLPREKRSQGGATIMRFANSLMREDPRIFHQALVSQWENPGDIVINPPPVQTDFARALPQIPMEYMDICQLVDLATYLVDDVLCKVDRASMAISLEVRVPILDTRVVEFAWGLPVHFKRRGDTLKWVLRNVLYRHVPRELIDRPKMGFGVPIGHWLRGELRDWGEDLLNERRLRENGLLNAATVHRLWNEHQSGAMDHADRLWAVLQFQGWLRSWGGPAVSQAHGGVNDAMRPMEAVG